MAIREKPTRYNQKLRAVQLDHARLRHIWDVLLREAATPQYPHLKPTITLDEWRVAEHPDDVETLPAAKYSEVKIAATPSGTSSGLINIVMDRSKTNIFTLYDDDRDAKDRAATVTNALKDYQVGRLRNEMGLVAVLVASWFLTLVLALLAPSLAWFYAGLLVVLFVMSVASWFQGDWLKVYPLDSRLISDRRGRHLPYLAPGVGLLGIAVTALLAIIAR